MLIIFDNKYDHGIMTMSFQYFFYKKQGVLYGKSST